MMEEVNWKLENAQADLMKRRPKGGRNGRVVMIGQIGAKLPSRLIPPSPESPAPNPQSDKRLHVVRPLGEFGFEHLAHEWQRERLKRGIDKCRKWLTEYEAHPGLSMVLAGPVGVGKTTMAENLLQQFKVTVRPFALVGVVGDKPVYEYDDDLAVTMLNGRLLDANELMRIMSDPFTLTGIAFRDARVIVIDDAGTENFATDSYTPSEEQERSRRHSAYGRFFDWAQRNGRYVVVTTNVPMVSRDEAGKPIGFTRGFVDVFGAKGFSRLQQMASGYFVDLDGLPDYRPVQALE